MDDEKMGFMSGTVLPLLYKHTKKVDWNESQIKSGCIRNRGSESASVTFKTAFGQQEEAWKPVGAPVGSATPNGYHGDICASVVLKTEGKQQP